MNQIPEKKKKRFQLTKCSNEKNIMDNYTVWGMRSTIGPLNLWWEYDSSKVI